MSKFDDLLLETTEHVLKRVFGEMATDFILGYLIEQSKLKENDVFDPNKVQTTEQKVNLGENPEVFEVALRKIFGDSEAVSVENLILEDTCSKIGLIFERKLEYRFSDYIRALKKKCDDSGGVKLEEKDKGDLAEERRVYDAT